MRTIASLRSWLDVLGYGFIVGLLHELVQVPSKTTSILAVFTVTRVLLMITFCALYGFVAVRLQFRRWLNCSVAISFCLSSAAALGQPFGNEELGFAMVRYGVVGGVSILILWRFAPNLLPYWPLGVLLTLIDFRNPVASLCALAINKPMWQSILLLLFAHVSARNSKFKLICLPLIAIFDLQTMRHTDNSILLLVAAAWGMPLVARIVISIQQYMYFSTRLQLFGPQDQPSVTLPKLLWYARFSEHGDVCCFLPVTDTALLATLQSTASQGKSPVTGHAFALLSWPVSAAPLIAKATANYVLSKTNHEAYEQAYARLTTASNKPSEVAVFHGTRAGNIASIGAHGFVCCRNTNHSKWYGNGAYFTTNADHALRCSVPYCFATAASKGHLVVSDLVYSNTRMITKLLQPSDPEYAIGVNDMNVVSVVNAASPKVTLNRLKGFGVKVWLKVLSLVGYYNDHADELLAVSDTTRVWPRYALEVPFK
eukprot:TRINITY_DN12634_c0_g1_i1.p1 TRINITY_DN12634_c0_g1~~TRINITY_DN12634_c0_g1_i1.p1  ORF type:complete len:484 (+),score=48.89 TRINITY_DN12634_c0_g1_i1:144-1595(+)